MRGTELGKYQGFAQWWGEGGGGGGLWGPQVKKLYIHYITSYHMYIYNISLASLIPKLLAKTVFTEIRCFFLDHVA